MTAPKEFQDHFARSSFWNQVQEAMEKKKVSNSDLASSLGVSRALVSKWLHGNLHNFTFSTASNIAFALGLEFMPTLQKKTKWEEIK